MSDLAGQYARQYHWRSWPQAYALLPPLHGARVLDLGCAIGDQARDLAARGASVHGIDSDAALVALARARGIAGATFAVGDIRWPAIGETFDGIWASFVPAYFPALGPVLARWRDLLRPGGWIALVEVSGLFAHEPLPDAARAFLDDYARDAIAAGRYGFDMGASSRRSSPPPDSRWQRRRSCPIASCPSRDRPTPTCSPPGPRALRACGCCRSARNASAPRCKMIFWAA